ncbi:regulatory protein RecX [Planctomonas psychrotolerans]|uniref:regulatory protein RecX n=1 Tax=Planctomonas psychrotolerans TaxID=2528712 RepID=UPI001238C5BD|nr:regulatory protein RecX [Planctomonas psychrotolerans]
MVSFPPESDRNEDSLAPVTYLPGVFHESGAGSAAEDVESPEERAHAASAAATRALARRGMSRSEVHSFLAERDFEDDEIEAELDRLERAGFLDDADLAEALVRTHHERKGLGRNAVSQELARRKIDPRIIAEAVSGIDDDDELARATEVAIKRAGQLTGLDAATAERRLNAYMMRRGYSSSIVREVTKAALADLPGKTGRSGRPSGSSSVRFR